LSKIFLLVTVMLFSGCSTMLSRPYPELIEKNYAPVRGGVVQHIKVTMPDDIKHYAKASMGIMKDFCNGPFNIISQKTTTKTVGYSTSSSKSFAHTTPEEEEFVQVKFECGPEQKNEVSN
jgi:hypothetical protein